MLKYTTSETTPYKHMQPTIKKTLDSLLNYYRSTNDNLSYEFKNGDNFVHVIITGKNQFEEGIGRFYLPLTYTTATGKVLIFTDMRPCVSIKDENFTTIESIVRDTSLYNIKKTHIGLISYDIENDGFDEMYNILVIRMFATIFGTVIMNNTKININEFNDLKYVLAYYYVSLIYPDVDHDQKVVKIAKALGKVRDIDTIDGLIIEPNYKLETVYDLEKYIKEVLSNSRVSKLNTQTLYMLFTSIMFGTEVKHYLMVALENPILFSALIYNGYVDKLYKKTMTYNVMHKQAKYIETKEFVQKIELFKKIIEIQ